MSFKKLPLTFMMASSLIVQAAYAMDNREEISSHNNNIRKKSYKDEEYVILTLDEQESFKDNYGVQMIDNKAFFITSKDHYNEKNKVSRDADFILKNKKTLSIPMSTITSLFSSNSKEQHKEIIKFYMKEDIKKDQNALLQEHINHIILEGELDYKIGWEHATLDPTLMVSSLRKFSSLKALEIEKAPLNEKMVELINKLPLLQKLSLTLRKKKEISLIKEIKNVEKIKVQFQMNKKNSVYKITEIPQSARDWLSEHIEKKVLTTSDKTSRKALIGAFIRGDITIEMPMYSNGGHGLLSFYDSLTINLSSNEDTFKKFHLSYAHKEGDIDFFASFFKDIPFEYKRWEKKVEVKLIGRSFMTYGFTLMKKNEK